MASNLDGLNLRFLLLNGCIFLITIFSSLTLAPAYTPLYFKYRVLKFIVGMNIDMNISNLVILKLQINMCYLYSIQSGVFLINYSFISVSVIKFVPYNIQIHLKGISTVLQYT